MSKSTKFEHRTLQQPRRAVEHGKRAQGKEHQTELDSDLPPICVVLGKLLHFSESRYNFCKVEIIMNLHCVRIELGSVSGWHIVGAIIS